MLWLGEVYECKDCGYRGGFIIRDGELAKQPISEEWKEEIKRIKEELKEEELKEEELKEGREEELKKGKRVSPGFRAGLYGIIIGAIIGEIPGNIIAMICWILAIPLGLLNVSMALINSALIVGIAGGIVGAITLGYLCYKNGYPLK